MKMKNRLSALKQKYQALLNNPVARWALIGVLLALIVIIPILNFQQRAYWVRVIGYTGLYIILGLGLNVVVGLAGLLDLGYVAFYAIGAYTYYSQDLQAYYLESPFFGCVVITWRS